MSHLARAITAKRTGEIRAVVETPLSSLMAVYEQWTPESATLRCASRYRIGVTLEFCAFVVDGAPMIPAMNRANRAIIEAVFGEFREHLIAIRVALSDHDLHTAHDRLDDLERKMFSVEDVT